MRETSKAPIPAVSEKPGGFLMIDRTGEWSSQVEVRSEKSQECGCVLRVDWSSKRENAVLSVYC